MNRKRNLSKLRYKLPYNIIDDIFTYPIVFKGFIPIHPQECVVLGEAIARAIRPSKPLTYLEQLECTADFGWLFPTSKVKELIEVKPRSKKGESVYSHESFNECQD